MADMEAKDVLAYLPHRYPMLLIDRVVECTPGESIVALKNVTINEPFFPGHYPAYPVLPGVLILEAMAQATGIMLLRALETLPDENSVYFLVGIDRARFRKPVVPGDQLSISVQSVRRTRGVSKVKAVARVDGAVAADAELMAALREVKD